MRLSLAVAAALLCATALTGILRSWTRRHACAAGVSELISASLNYLVRFLTVSWTTQCRAFRQFALAFLLTRPAAAPASLRDHGRGAGDMPDGAMRRHVAPRPRLLSRRTVIVGSSTGPDG